MEAFAIRSLGDSGHPTQLDAVILAMVLLLLQWIAVMIPSFSLSMRFYVLILRNRLAIP